MESNKYTIIGFIISITILIFSLVFDLDIFEKLNAVLQSIEYFEVDEIIIPLAVFFSFFVINQIKNKKSTEVKLEQVKIYTP